MERPPSPSLNDELREPVQRVFDWMMGLRAPDGRILCPEHQVEHSGKNAGAIVMALELAKHSANEQALELLVSATQQGQRLVQNLVREGSSPCFTFRPGRHDPFNCSNSVIDGGAASDALGQLGRELAARGGSAADVEAFRAASLKHARTYLRYAVLDKGIPAQRAWGLTGLASAWACEHDGVLEEAALQAVQLLAGIQNDDGSYPYHPLEWGATHPGASDVSAYYQSRVSAFLMRALEDLGRDPSSREFGPPILAGLDFLCALQGPNGIKTGLVEAKPWYWGATYEVASHPFDVYALATGWRLFGEPRYAVAALRAFRAWAAHLDTDGEIHSHRPGAGRGRSYQCPTFWAGHAMWIARALDDLQAITAADLESTEESGGAIDLCVEDYAGAQLVRLEDEQVVAWIRGSRPGVNVSHGSPHGAGLLRVVRKSDGEELIARCRLGGHQMAEWSGKSGLPSPTRGLRSGAKEVRFSSWLARVHWRAGRRAEAIKTPLKVFKRGVLAFAHSRVSSAFALDVSWRSFTGGVSLEAPLAWRDGTAVPGTRLRREFRVEGDGLIVTETMLEAEGVRALDYPVPPAAQDVERKSGEIRYRLS